MYRTSEVDVLAYTAVGDFYLWPDRIVCHQRVSNSDGPLELYLLGLVLCFWLERHGRRVLHASAVSVDALATVFLASREGGKTSLSASLMQAGHPMLTDDFLALSLSGEGAIGYPGFPQMRMWPDLAEHFLGTSRDLPRVLPDTDKRRVPVGDPDGLGPFCEEPRPLARMYIPERRAVEESGEEVTFELVSPRDAVIELVRESFLATILECAGLHAERFHSLVSLVQRVPVLRVSYPSGLEHLPRVREAILEDMRAAP
jgi:hypothetical protein